MRRIPIYEENAVDQDLIDEGMEKKPTGAVANSNSGVRKVGRAS
jgi:hypothetical protein